MLAAPDDDDNPFLTSDYDETNEMVVEDTDWLHLIATHFLAQCTRPRFNIRNYYKTQCSKLIVIA